MNSNLFCGNARWGEHEWLGVGTRRRGLVLRIRRICSVALLPLFIAACQEGSPLPLKNSDLTDPASATARLLDLDTCTDPPLNEVLLTRLVDSINQQREKAGLRAVRREDTLMVIADFYACRLAEGGFFSHRDPFDNSTVDSRAISFGYPFYKVGENLAAGQLGVDEVVEAWMASPGHRANILDPDFTEIGVAVKLGGSDGPYWVQEFGRPSNEPVRLVRQSGAAAVEPTTQPMPDAGGQATSEPSE